MQLSPIITVLILALVPLGCLATGQPSALLDCLLTVQNDELGCLRVYYTYYMCLDLATSLQHTLSTIFQCLNTLEIVVCVFAMTVLTVADNEHKGSTVGHWQIGKCKMDIDRLGLLLTNLRRPSQIVTHTVFHATQKIQVWEKSRFFWFGSRIRIEIWDCPSRTGPKEPNSIQCRIECSLSTCACKLLKYMIQGILP